MTMKIAAIGPERNISEAAKEMATDEIGSLLVTREGEYVGIIAEADIIRKGIVRVPCPLQHRSVEQTVDKGTDRRTTGRQRHRFKSR